MWSRRGIRSRNAAALIWWVLRDSGIGSISGFSMVGSGAGAGAGSGAGGGVISGTLSSGTSMASRGAMPSGAGVTTAILGWGKGPFGSPSSPVSPSGTEDGAATGSEKTGSTLVVLVISSIAFCRSLSTVG